MIKRKRRGVTYHRLSFGEREEISRSLAHGKGVRSIGRILGRNASTISREIERVAKGGKKEEYRAITANARALRNRKNRVAKENWISIRN